MSGQNKSVESDIDIRVAIKAIYVDQDSRRLDNSQLGYTGEVIVAVLSPEETRVRGGEIVEIRVPFANRNLDEAVKAAFRRTQYLGEAIAKASAEVLRAEEPSQTQEEGGLRDQT